VKKEFVKSPIFWQVTWFKNDVPIEIDDDARYELVEQGNARSLIIKDVTHDDIAMYRISGLGGSYTANLVVDGGKSFKSLFEMRLMYFS